MDFKKMLEYNSPKNLKRRLNKIAKWLLGLNNIQKIILLFVIANLFGMPEQYGISGLHGYVQRSHFMFSVLALSIIALFLFKDKK